MILPVHVEPGPSDHSHRKMSIPPPTLTDKQGQYLAFIHLYTKLNRRPPAHADIQRYFEVTAPTVHNMLVLLEERGFIRRKFGQARSIEVVLDQQLIPPLR